MELPEAEESHIGLESGLEPSMAKGGQAYPCTDL